MLRAWFIKSFCASVLGWLLHRANSCPPYLHREEFYKLKTELCHRFGWWQRAELQHILKECWDCDPDAAVVKGCRKCLMYGRRPGVWEEFWVRLELWKVGSYYFHEPKLRYYLKPEWDGKEIEGYIRHEGYTRFRLHSECWLWLALLFDRKSFWRDVQSVERGGWLPLLIFARFWQLPRRRTLERWQLRFQRRWRTWQKRRALILPKFEAQNEDDIPF